MDQQVIRLQPDYLLVISVYHSDHLIRNTVVILTTVISVKIGSLAI
ncbi:hypothetical protein SAMN05443550_106110 [Pedobacter hartonius]|uniref:Uncharacterized protein n=1 Tax=Pedobacter hartonius TaxID=425514 RepID=A0A1H4ESS6_9SPHI|nr:hypothetical protein SAMN05443550_106110 [Pedobacter hartonius]